MGRAKVSMKLIEKKKSRHITFKKRKEGLVRKMHEFSTLCDVEACMIVYGPKQENDAADQPEIWPQDLDQVRRLAETYKSKKNESGNKTFGLENFFQERQRKVEDELSKLRKRNMEVKYPTPVNLINNMSEWELREFASVLRNKAEFVKSKIEELKRSDRLNSQLYPPPGGNEMHYPMYCPTATVDHHHQQMMLMMNGGDQFGVGGASSSSGSNIQFEQFKQPVIYEASMGQNSRVPPLPFYFTPLQPYMVEPPQVSFSRGWENQDGATREAIDRYHMHMKNHGG